MTHNARQTRDQEPPKAKPRLEHQPALDGLRGLGMLWTLFFHAQFSWAVGGFLTIAMFFTLSGFLITSLFLVEWENTGTIHLGRFWARRLRRLMPAALLTLGAMPLFAIFVATPDQLERLRGDVLWALAYAANWHFILTDAAYQNLFTAPSPVHHFWSLAIEEQFYLVFPLIAFAGLWLGNGSRGILVVILSVLATVSVVASIWLIESGAAVDRAYYGSDSRASELLIGGILACFLQGRELSSESIRRLVQVIGVCSLALMVYLWLWVDLAESWLYTGGLTAYTVVSSGVIVASVQPSGPVRKFLSMSLLCWIGRVSYGAYLFHWPIFLWLSADATGLSPVPLLALRLAVTFALAALSYRFFESPIRSGRALTSWRAVAAVPAAFAAVVFGVTVASSSSGYSTAEVKRGIAEMNKAIAEAEAHPTDLDEAPGLGKDKPRVAVFGDSGAVYAGIGLGVWLQKEGRGRIRVGMAEPGCPLVQVGKFRCGDNINETPNRCSDRETVWRGKIESTRADIAVVYVGPWDFCDRQLPGDDTWRVLGDPVLDKFIVNEMLKVTDLLGANGALVVWVTQLPSWTKVKGKVPKTPLPHAEPARMLRYNELMKSLEELRPGRAAVVDLSAYMRTIPDEIDEYRPDGTHLSPRTAVRLSYEWLGDAVLDAYRNATRP